MRLFRFFLSFEGVADIHEDFELGGLRSFRFDRCGSGFWMLLVVGFEFRGIELRFLLGGGIHDLDDDEEDDGDDDEGKDRIDQGAPVDDRGHVVGPGRAVEGVKAEERVLPLDEGVTFDGDVDALGFREGDDHVIDFRGGEELTIFFDAVDDHLRAFLRIGDGRKDGDETFKASRDRPSGERGQDVDERIDDRGERAADDDANGKHEGVAFVDEGLEFGDDAFSGFLSFGSTGRFFFFGEFCHKCDMNPPESYFIARLKEWEITNARI